MTIGQPSSVDEDHVIWTKAPEQLLNGLWGEIVLSAAEQTAKIN